jgi:hypothetical protein
LQSKPETDAKPENGKRPTGEDASSGNLKLNVHLTKVACVQTGTCKTENLLMPILQRMFGFTFTIRSVSAFSAVQGGATQHQENSVALQPCLPDWPQTPEASLVDVWRPPLAT